MERGIDFVKQVLSCCKKRERVYKTYIVLDTLSGLYKIGKATNVEKRVKALSVANINLSLVFVIEKNCEFELQKHFSSKKVKSEWFNLGDDDIAEIKKKYNC